MGRERRVVFTIFGIMVLISILIISIPEAQAIPFTLPFELEDENSEVIIDITPPTPSPFPASLQPIGVENWKVDLMRRKKY